MKGRLLILYLAANAVTFAALPPGADNPFRGLNFPWVSSWALGDLNGDQKIDVVTTRPGRRDSQGYSHEVDVRLGGSPEKGSFTFRGPSARVRLSIRDLDGDHDWDIVILEASSPEALGVWLNDGLGNFHEGDVAKFRTALSGRNSPALWLPKQDNDPAAAIFERRIDPAVLDTLAIEREPGLETVDWETSPQRGQAHCSNRRSRAPPCNT